MRAAGGAPLFNGPAARPLLLLAKREISASPFSGSDPATNGPAGCGVQAAASVAKFAARYLALPVVPDGMIMSVTCLSLGLISRTSLFASLVYSNSLATETCLVALLGNWRIDSD
jgi:hypothetical protein